MSPVFRSLRTRGGQAQASPRLRAAQGLAGRNGEWGLGSRACFEGPGLWLLRADSQVHRRWDSCRPKCTAPFSAAGPVSTVSILQGEARPGTGTGDRQVDGAFWHWPDRVSSGPAFPCFLFAVPQAPRCGRGWGRPGVGWGGGAYRGGAGRENVITRSSLLKVRHRLAGTEFMGEEGVTLGWGWAWARRPPQSLPQGDARSPRPQGQEATDKYIRDPLFPLLPTPTTWRGGFGDPENKDQAAGQAGEASRADATRRRLAAAVTAFASGQATDWTQPLARGSWPTPPWTPVSLGCPSQTQSSKQTPPPTTLSIP